MSFDMDTLSPLYKLEIGQPGSSFTFEVAILNGFENELINRAKLKLDPKKIKMDALLHDIQKEKNYLERLIKEHEIAQKEAYASKEYHEEKSSKLNAKLSSQNQLVEQYNKEIQAGKKMLSFIDRFNVKSRKKNSNENLYAEIKNYLTLEKSKKSIKETTSKKLDSSVKKKTIVAQEKKSVDFEQDKIKTGSLVQLISSNR
ncbi:MAG: DNA mismatch repair protein MutS, partial [Crocinitomicaceae bacterium]